MFTAKGYSVIVTDLKPDAERQRAGLCADCRFMRLTKSDRGSTFYFCQRSATQPEFPKYPRLPVLKCSGYEPAAPRGLGPDPEVSH